VTAKLLEAKNSGKFGTALHMVQQSGFDAIAEDWAAQHEDRNFRAVTISLRRLVPFCLFFGEPDGFSRGLSHVEAQHDLFLALRMLLSPQYEE
jgi:hypothetical protein